MKRVGMSILTVVLLTGFALPATSACAADASVAARRDPTSPEQYRIGPEDILLISVWKNEAMTRTVPVRPDGMVSMPLVNDLEVAGLTPMELRDLLTKRLREYIPNAEVSVILTEYRSFKVSVMGEVNKPARYELKAAATVLDALAMAGGFTQFASRTRIVVLRANGKGMQRVPFNYNKVVASEQDNFYLAPGDIVLVP
jgi:polysaccharide export outer membrane protein